MSADLALRHALEAAFDDMAKTLLRRVHNPEFGDIVLPHLVIGLEQEVEVENGEVLRLYKLANGRTGGQKCPPGTPQIDFRFNIVVVD
jgi:hypothetical protein